MLSVSHLDPYIRFENNRKNLTQITVSNSGKKGIG
jgi:hypothetical protein